MRSDQANKTQIRQQNKTKKFKKIYGRRHKFYVLNAFCAGNFMRRKIKIKSYEDE